MIARLGARYLLVFAMVLAALSAGAYVFMGREYAALLQPALGTPEATQAYRVAMNRVLLTIVAFDVPLLIVVGVASWWLARASLAPLIEARERERAFAADAAHELRSPLATIGTLAQAARPQAAGEVAQSLDEIARQSLEASQLIGELLTLSRSARPTLLQREPVDVAAVFRGVSREFASQARDRGIQISVPADSAIVNGDERRLRELARNLLSNAVRHARSNITVASQRNGGTVEIMVSNDGQEIPAHVHERIFERFYRHDPSGDGSGLGLALVRWIATAHGGHAYVRSEPGGPEFVVRLPAAHV